MALRSSMTDALLGSHVHFAIFWWRRSRRVENYWAGDSQPLVFF